MVDLNKRSDMDLNDLGDYISEKEMPRTKPPEEEMHLSGSIGLVVIPICVLLWFMFLLVMHQIN